MLEKIAKDMPRITPKQIRKHILSVNMGLKIAEDECQLLAEQGWRKVPSVNALVVELSRIELLRDLRSITPLAEELHRWWMEGE